VTRLARFVRNILEMLLARFYEGPEPPKRLAEMVLVFANMHPRATRAEWTAFAQAHANETYRTGYVRGLEFAERDLDRRPKDDPERLMAAMGYGDGWLDEPVDLSAPTDVVQEEPRAMGRSEQWSEYNAAIEHFNKTRRFQPPPG
jgi:hypothetical protein